MKIEEIHLYMISDCYLSIKAIAIQVVATITMICLDDIILKVTTGCPKVSLCKG